MKKLSVTLLLLLLVSFALGSCMIPGMGGGTEEEGNGEGGGEGSEKENLICDSETTLYLVYDPENLSEEEINEIFNEFNSKGIYVELYGLNPEVKEHELVLGDVGRDISDEAYSRLDRKEQNGESDIRYLIYSDGSSVAISYDYDYERHGLSAALDYFWEHFLAEEITIPEGVAYRSNFDLYYTLEEQDAAAYAEKWDELYSALGAQGDELYAALRYLYTVYDGESLVNWASNLLDADICVCKSLYGETECKKTQWCGTAGFYFSNSARDTAGFLPDAESTLQALGIISSCIMKEGERGYEDYLPEWLSEKLCAFAYNLQDPDGYFYHPQWGKSVSGARRGRDYEWCLGMLRNFGKKPRYATIASSYTTDGELSNKFGSSTATMVSKVIMADSETLIPDYLQSVEAFKQYLIDLDFIDNAYSAGNTISAQSTQIKAVDRKAGGVFTEALIEHLNSTQRENGLWYSETDYTGINGLMKISGVYSSFYTEMPNAEIACRAAFNAIGSDAECRVIVDIWNAWEACVRILGNITDYGGGKEAADAIRRELIPDMAAAVTATRDKLEVFLKKDGSFVYQATGRTSGISMGVPVAVVGSDEGDMNATRIGATGMLSSIFSTMGMSDYLIPLGMSKERAIFYKNVESISPIDKSMDNAEVGEPVGFEDYEVGDSPAEVAPIGKGNNIIIEDPYGDNGKVLQFDGVKNSGDYLLINNTGPKKNVKGMVFEGDMCFESEGATKINNLLRLELGESGEQLNAYRLTFTPTASGVEIRETSASRADIGIFNPLITVGYGEWFKLRIEYYIGDHENVRIKVYFNEKLLAISDNYYDNTGEKLKGEGIPNTDLNLTRFYVLKDYTIKTYFDNLASYTITDSYVYEELHEDYRYDASSINVDKISEDGVVFDMDEIGVGGELPKEFSTVGTGVKVKEVGGENLLSVYGGSSLSVPTVKRVKNPSVSSVSLEITPVTPSGDSFGKLVLEEAAKTNNPILSLTLRKVTDDSGEYVVLVDGEGNTVSGVKLPIGEATLLTVDCYSAEGAAIIYVNGEKKGMCGAPSSVSLTFGKIKVSTSGELYLDQISVERTTKSFAEATKPSKDSEVYDFSGGKGNIDSVGTSLESVVGDVKLKLDGTGASVSVPKNDRDSAMNYTEFSFDIGFKNIKKDGLVYKIELLNADGEIVFAFGLESIGENIGITEVTSLGTHPSMKEFTRDNGASIRLEVYESVGICKVFIDGEYIFATSFLYSKGVNREISNARITAGEAAATGYLDNIYLERYGKVYNGETADSVKAEESDTVTFDYSSVGSLPEDVSALIYSGAPEASVVEAEKDGVGDKVLMFKSVSNSDSTMDQLIFYNLAKTSVCKSYVFEADIMIGSASSGTVLQFYFMNGSKRATEININCNSGQLSLNQRNYVGGGLGEKMNIGSLGQWMKLRIEYYCLADSSETRVKVFIDDTLLYVTDIPYSKTPEATLTHVSFNALKAASLTMYVDNVSFSESSAAYDGQEVDYTA